MKTFIRSRFGIFILPLAFLFILAGFARCQSADYQTNKAAAEQFYANGSYARAYALYTNIDASSLPPDEARWVAFRVADTQWRSAAASDNPDSTTLDEARTSLGLQVRDLTRDDQHDRVW